METLTTAVRIHRLSTALALAAVVAVGAGLAAARPAFADEHDLRRERVEHGQREHREHAEREREDRGRWEHQRYVPPRPIYAPPPVVYAPPFPPPGINFSFNIR
ncbi:MAG TPA: hypothetical protein VGD08_08810 [Stellaceae bacterium]|jgi:Ni/Co efflux regulator RcnB